MKVKFNPRSSRTLMVLYIVGAMLVAANVGLIPFEEGSGLDEEIYSEISGLIDNWEGDGRVFRDCEHNYNYLFGLVDDDKLMEDYNKVVEKTNGR